MDITIFHPSPWLHVLPLDKHQIIDPQDPKDVSIFQSFFNTAFFFLKVPNQGQSMDTLTLISNARILLQEVNTKVPGRNRVL